MISSPLETLFTIKWLPNLIISRSEALLERQIIDSTKPSKSGLTFTAPMCTVNYTNHAPKTLQLDITTRPNPLLLSHYFSKYFFGVPVHHFDWSVFQLDQIALYISLIVNQDYWCKTVINLNYWLLNMEVTVFKEAALEKHC